MKPWSSRTINVLEKYTSYNTWSVSYHTIRNFKRFWMICGKKVSRSYKQKPCEVKIWPYNTVILKHLKSNAYLQFVTGVYEVLT